MKDFIPFNEWSMELADVRTAVKEAERFAEKARALEARLKLNPSLITGCKETSAVRRASLDLTDALAQMRKA